MSIDIKGLDRLYRKLGKAAAMQTLEKPMQRSVLRLQRRMQDYPPAPAHSSYIRTGTLGRRWTTRIERSGNGLVGKVGNNTEYGPLVQSSRFQTRFHKRTGWTTDDQVVREEQAAIVADFQATIDKALAEG